MNCDGNLHACRSSSRRAKCGRGVRRRRRGRVEHTAALEQNPNPRDRCIVSEQGLDLVECRMSGVELALQPLCSRDLRQEFGQVRAIARFARGRQDFAELLGGSGWVVVVPEFVKVRKVAARVTRPIPVHHSAPIAQDARRREQAHGAARRPKSTHWPAPDGSILRLFFVAQPSGHGSRKGILGDRGIEGTGDQGIEGLLPGAGNVGRRHSERSEESWCMSGQMPRFAEHDVQHSVLPVAS